MDPQPVQEAPKKSNPMKYILLTLSLVIIGVVVFSLGVFTPKPTPKKTTPSVATGPTPTPYKHTILSFTPNPLQITGTDGSAEVSVNPQSNPVTAVQLEITYDPKVLTNVTVQSEKSFFPAPIVLINKSNKVTGHITYALGITPAQQPVTAAGNVVKIMFSKVPGSTAKQTIIKLDPETLVSASGIGPSVLKESSNLTVNF